MVRVSQCLECDSTCACSGCVPELASQSECWNRSELEKSAKAANSLSFTYLFVAVRSSRPASLSCPELVLTLLLFCLFTCNLLGGRLLWLVGIRRCVNRRSNWLRSGSPVAKKLLTLLLLPLTACSLFLLLLALVEFSLCLLLPLNTQQLFVDVLVVVITW